MEDRFLDLSSEFGSERKPHTYYFEKYCSDYISIGMTYEQFWDDDPEITKYYRQSYNKKREQENFGYWLQGLYIYRALLSIWPAMRFGSKEKVKDYIEKPIPLTKEQIDENKLSKEKAQFDRNLAFMSRFSKVFNEKFEKE